MVIEDSLVVDGCLVDGTVQTLHLINLSSKFIEGAVVEDAVVMSNAIIGKGAVVAIIGRCGRTGEKVS